MSIGLNPTRTEHRKMDETSTENRTESRTKPKLLGLARSVWLGFSWCFLGLFNFRPELKTKNQSVEPKLRIEPKLLGSVRLGFSQFFWFCRVYSVLGRFCSTLVRRGYFLMLFFFSFLYFLVICGNGGVDFGFVAWVWI